LLLFVAVRILAAPGGAVHHLHIEGVINPIKVRYIENAFQEARARNASLIVISINTPGGLVESMERIVATIVNSPIPVVTFVEPQAAMATSAGTFLVFPAMVPGTTIGSAHPVGGQGEKIDGPMEEKVINTLVAQAKNLAERRKRNVVFAEAAIRSSMNLNAEAAQETKVIEIIASDLTDLLKKLHGYRIDHENRRDTIITAGLPVHDVPLTRAEEFLDALANPSIAYILMTLGVMGLIYEFASPGVGLGAIVGSISLLLGLLSLSALPIHLGGILFLLLGLIMLGLEVKLVSHGLLTVGGVISLVLGGFILVDAGSYYGAVQEVKFGVVLPLILGIVLVTLLAVTLTIRTLRTPQRMGSEALVGATGVAKTDLNPEGMVFLEGALWKARSSSGVVRAGEKIVVETRGDDGRDLGVRALSNQSKEV
jgi:membrane-bound serine protease (ClpP class)